MMGSDDHYPEEAPRHAVKVDGFWIDRAPVTNAEFARFVEETGHEPLLSIADSPEANPRFFAHVPYNAVRTRLMRTNSTIASITCGFSA